MLNRAWIFFRWASVYPVWDVLGAEGFCSYVLDYLFDLKTGLGSREGVYSESSLYLVCSFVALFKFSAPAFELDDIRGSDSFFVFIIVCDCFEAYIVLIVEYGVLEGLAYSS